MTNRRFSHTIEGVRGKVPREKGVVHFEKEPFARFFRQPVGIHSCLHRLCGRNGKHLDVPNPCFQIRRRLVPARIFPVCLCHRLFGRHRGDGHSGRATRSGPIGAFSQAVASRGKNPKIGAAIGFIPVLGSLALAIGYSVVMGWILRYLVASLTGEVLAPTDIDGFSAMFGSTASPFGNNLYVILSLVIAFIIMAFGIASGIEKANKIMMPLFFLLFLGLAVYMFFQPGAAEGYRYMFRIDPEAIRQKETWVYALGQAFFSLSLAGNGTLIYGSYLRDDEDIIGSAWKVALFDTLAAMLAALVIIPAMATAAASSTAAVPD